MRRTIGFPIVLLLFSAAFCWAGQPVSVQQLERVLAQSKNSSDGSLAQKLSELELTERFSTFRLMHWRGVLAGPKSQRALTRLADRSAFLRTPEADIPSPDSPDLAHQHKIMGLAAAYVTRSIPQLPHFYATRTITHFESRPGVAFASEGTDLSEVRISHALVQYQDGKEVAEPELIKASGAGIPDDGLRTWGVFGPILSLVLLDAAQNKLAWSHWEEGSDRLLAVYSYSVPRKSSHYEVRYCCGTGSYGMDTGTFHTMTGYHGEIAVDAHTGTIERLVLEADLEPSDPILRAAIMVEYGRVDIGGVPYTCPARSVSVSIARTVRMQHGQRGPDFPAVGPPQLLLNDAEFSQYHLYRAETHVLSAEEERKAGAAPDVTLPMPSRPGEPAAESVLDASASVANNVRPEVASAAVSPASENEEPEITATRTAALPGAAERPDGTLVQPPGAPDSDFRLRISARLVDVNVVALDKRGHPLPDLKQDDFEVYDNGVKQDIHSFSEAVAQDSAQPAVAENPDKAGGPLVFSNHVVQGSAKQGDSRRAPAAASAISQTGNTLVVLFDPGNMIYNDFVDARRQAIHFLLQLPANEPVALYAMRYHGYQVLEEPTTDHAAIMARLSKWMPSAQDLVNARDQEDRNRQHIETVHNLEDMLNVNGNFTLEPAIQQQAVDPKLRELGNMSGPGSLDTLVNVANHLASIPGHKSLVWITSDNALADWNRMSISIEKHSRFIAPAALRTQEAMNNARVSLYPLDASRLEASVVTADLHDRNVQLTPTYPDPGDGPPVLTAMLAAQLGPEAADGSDDADPNNPHAQDQNIYTHGRLFAQMQQDMRPIEGVFRAVADATGGRAFRRSSNIEGELDVVIAEAQSTYLLGFSPPGPADGAYHRLTVRLLNHPGATVRYRSGYQYEREPATLKERFARAVSEPGEVSEIAVSARPVTDSAGRALRVTIAGNDIDLSRQATEADGKTPEFWSGKLDIFLIQRDDNAQQAHVTGQTVGLRLMPGTYQRAVSDGLTFDERVNPGAGVASLRVIVVDVNSGRIGSVTVPVSAFADEAANRTN
ncbi:MAG TPA: VWA domain-containing protein [Terracidiphilus sp.]|nr:VWA domain-containing protein [Terracidiphilus sp.]